MGLQPESEKNYADILYKLNIFTHIHTYKINIL